VEIAVILGTYVVTSVFVYSYGPFGVLEDLRNVPLIRRSGLLDCFLCTSFWVALVLCMVFGRLDAFFIAWGAATVLDKLITAYSIK